MFKAEVHPADKRQCALELLFWNCSSILIERFSDFPPAQNSVQHATSFRWTRGLVKYTMKEKKKSTNIFHSVKAYFSLLELEWLSQKNSKKLPNFSQLLCTKGRKWRSKKGESVCLRCMSQFLLDQHDHVSTGKCPTMMLLSFRWRQVSFQWKVMANGKFPLSSALADKFGKYAINFESLHNVNTIHV